MRAFTQNVGTIGWKSSAEAGNTAQKACPARRNTARGAARAGKAQGTRPGLTPKNALRPACPTAAAAGKRTQAQTSRLRLPGRVIQMRCPRGLLGTAGGATARLLCSRLAGRLARLGLRVLFPLFFVGVFPRTGGRPARRSAAAPAALLLAQDPANAGIEQRHPNHYKKNCLHAMVLRTCGPLPGAAAAFSVALPWECFQIGKFCLRSKENELIDETGRQKTAVKTAPRARHGNLRPLIIEVNYSELQAKPGASPGTVFRLGSFALAARKAGRRRSAGETAQARQAIKKTAINRACPAITLRRARPGPRLCIARQWTGPAASCLSPAPRVAIIPLSDDGPMPTRSTRWPNSQTGAGEAEEPRPGG